MNKIFEKIIWRIIRSENVRNIIKKHNPLQDWPPERKKGNKLKPISINYGIERGTPIDRYYIAQFFEKYQHDIKGHVLDIGDNYYTKTYGKNNVVKSDILYPVKGNPAATIIGDLSTGKGIYQNTFDCIICIQTLQFIYDIKKAIFNAYKALKKDGVMLVTIPGIAKISFEDMNNWGEYWRITELCAKRIFQEIFPAENVTTLSYGNVYTSAAFLYGIAAEELSTDELNYYDNSFEMLVAVRAKK